MEAVKTDGGLLINVPEQGKIYLLEAMPHDPFGYRKLITDIQARSEQTSKGII
jgi:hypothetical protein